MERIFVGKKQYFVNVDVCDLKHKFFGPSKSDHTFVPKTFKTFKTEKKKKSY